MPSRRGNLGNRTAPPGAGSSPRNGFPGFFGRDDNSSDFPANLRKGMMAAKDKASSRGQSIRNRPKGKKYGPGAIERRMQSLQAAKKKANKKSSVY